MLGGLAEHLDRPVVAAVDARQEEVLLRAVEPDSAMTSVDVPW
jgi:hypothetical protein